MMQQRFITFTSMLFFLSHIAHGALVEDAKFISEADIPKMTIAKYAFAGAVTGMVQQTIFTLATSSRDIAASQFILSVAGSAIAGREINANMRTLKQFDDRAIDWMYYELTDHCAQRSLPRFRGHINQLRNGQMPLNPIYSPQEIYSAYNKLLTRFAKKQAFIQGYVMASVVGGVPSMAAMAAVMRLGFGR